MVIIVTRWLHCLCARYRSIGVYLWLATIAIIGAGVLLMFEDAVDRSGSLKLWPAIWQAGGTERPKMAFTEVSDETINIY